MRHPRVTVGLANRRDIVNGFPTGSERLWSARRTDGRLTGRLDADPEAGYLFVVDGYGAFLIAADGSSVACAPIKTPAWKWQRFLVGQVLPFVAVVHGFEVFHAGAVQLGTSGVAFLGGSAAGKSTLAVTAALRGAPMLTDDVLAVDVTVGPPDSPLWGQPGWALTNVRHAAAATVGDLAALGPPVGADDESSRLPIELSATPVPIRSVYVIDRPDEAGEVVIDDSPIDPRVLLGSSYNLVVQTPERLVRHLEACARLSNTATVSRLVIPRNVPPSAVIDAVEAHIVWAVAG
jgi:hypothetical protein